MPISALRVDFHFFNAQTILSVSKDEHSVGWMRTFIFVRAILWLMKSQQVNGRLLHSRLRFVGFVVRVCGTVGTLYFMLLVRRRLTCKNIICDYLDCEKLLHGNYLRRGELCPRDVSSCRFSLQADRGLKRCSFLRGSQRVKVWRLGERALQWIRDLGFWWEKLFLW